MRPQPIIVVFLLLLSACGAPTEPTTAAPTAAAKNNPRFTEVTSVAGLDFRHRSGAYGEFFMPEIMGGGAAFIDYNRDGRPDILLAGGGAWAKSDDQDVAAVRLYENTGGGRFKDVSRQAGLTDVKGYSFGFSVGDYDRDGDDDVYVTMLEKNVLLRCDDGRFTDVAPAAGVAGGPVWSTAALWTDVDKDGYLDLYVGNYVKWSKAIDRNAFCSLDGKNDNYCHPNLYDGEQGIFYRNRGDGTFVEATRAAGLTDANGVAPMKTLGLVSFDANRDGWPDLVLANDMQADLLFLNRGDGTFREAGPAAGIAYNRKGQPRAGMGIATGYLDGGEYPSIAVGNFSRQPISLFTATATGAFVDKAYASQIGKPSFLTLTFGMTFFDADLDGDEDLFAANGHVFTDIAKKAANISFRQPPHLFLNDGHAGFQDYAPVHAGPLADSLVARASAYADIDNDGDLDLLVTENNGPVRLLRNDTERTGGYLRIFLTGTVANPNAVDAELTLTTSSGRRLIRRVKSSDSYLAQSEFAVTFGLQAGESPGTLSVRWPDAADTTEKFTDLKANSFYHLTQGEAPQKMTN